MPSYRTATFNGVALGDYISPAEDHRLDVPSKFNVPHTVKKIFESNTPIVEADGNFLSEYVLVFSKDVAISTSLNTDEKMLDWFENTFKPAMMPTAGSQTAYSLVTTDGTTTNTRTNCYFQGAEIIHNSYGLLRVKCTFYRKGA